MKIYCQNVWNYNPCDYRNKLIASLVNELDADVCMFQECGPGTNRTGAAPLPTLLKETYTEIRPEFSNRNYTPVFYKTDRYNVVDSHYFCYDGLNDANSKSVTWAVLEDKLTFKRVAVASTHFWWMFRGEEDNQQRLQNVVQLKECCEKLVSQYDVPVIIGGDFNNGKNAEQGDMPYQTMLKEGFCDIRLTAKETTELLTHHEYPFLNEEGIYEKGSFPERILDYIFTYSKSVIIPEKFDVLISQNALDSSDHCPLIGIFSL